MVEGPCCFAAGTCQETWERRWTWTGVGQVGDSLVTGSKYTLTHSAHFWTGVSHSQLCRSLSNTSVVHSLTHSLATQYCTHSLTHTTLTHTLHTRLTHQLSHTHILYTHHHCSLCSLLSLTLTTSDSCTLTLTHTLTHTHSLCTHYTHTHSLLLLTCSLRLTWWLRVEVMSIHLSVSHH